MSRGKHILKQFTKRWQLLLGIETLNYGIGFALFIYFISFNLLISLLGFLLVLSLATLIIKPWKPNLDRSSQFIDRELKTAEYSTSLFLKPSEQLSDLAKLQQHKIANSLKEDIRRLKPPNKVFRSSITALILVVIGLLAYQLNVLNLFQSPINDPIPNNAITFQPLDSIKSNTAPPQISNQSVTIYFPNYTNLKATSSSDMDIKAVEGSRIKWYLEFNAEVKQVTMESMGNKYPMESSNQGYSRSSVLQNSGFYNFKFADTLDHYYSSIFYAIEVVKDEAPTIEILDIDQFTSFEVDEQKIVSFETKLSDDYGLNDAHIIATVSKGSGESVKFREEKISFDRAILKGSKSVALSKQIDLDKLKMEPGDELYFYVEATDLKAPKANRSRSETFFAAIKDTVSYVFGVEGSLGVNRMPDYFRSQRQLIIDTEKLIAEKKSLSEKDFKFTSNELGFDQKALRMKYAEFMGEETESGIVIEEDLEALDSEDDHDDEETDPLAEYTHDHDGDNEHNLVNESGAEKSNNPLEEFIHDHEDPEAATLFEESLKSKLLKALNEMWDAELYLRLYTPEQSLPYQYRALGLIQEIKNSARIYVHRIGFDPPPIKEDKRLTGKLEDIKNYRKNENLEQEAYYPFIREAIFKLEQILSKDISIDQGLKELFEQAGNELATLAIENPGKHLKTLQQLKTLTTFGEPSKELLRNVQIGLHAALPKNKLSPFKSEIYMDELNQLLLKELENND